jgi:hypothetical protein
MRGGKAPDGAFFIAQIPASPYQAPETTENKDEHRDKDQA